MLEEITVPFDQITINADGTISVREATIILRDGVRDESIPARYHRYVLAPGEATDGKPERIAAVAATVWTGDVVKAYADKQAAIAAAEAARVAAQAEALAAIAIHAELIKA